MSLSKTLYSLKVLVIPRKLWLRPDTTEKLLTGMLSINTNKQIVKQKWIKLVDEIRRAIVDDFAIFVVVSPLNHILWDR